MNLTILLTSCTDDSKLVSIQYTREFSQVFTLVQLLGGREGREGGRDGEGREGGRDGEGREGEGWGGKGGGEGWGGKGGGGGMGREGRGEGGWGKGRQKYNGQEQFPTASFLLSSLASHNINNVH